MPCKMIAVYSDNGKWSDNVSHPLAESIATVTMFGYSLLLKGHRFRDLDDSEILDKVNLFN